MPSPLPALTCDGAALSAERLQVVPSVEAALTCDGAALTVERLQVVPSRERVCSVTSLAERTPMPLMATCAAKHLD